MNRRSFLGNLLTLEEVNNSGVNDTNSILANDLEAYLPDVKSPWDI